MENLTFPRHSPDTIVSYVRSEILEGAEARNLVKEDLFSTSRHDVLQLIYLRILQKVCKIQLEEVYMMPLNVDIMYPVIYEGFLPVCNLYIRLERLLPMWGISDFQIADVLSPKTKRTVRFLSGMLNFVNFMESQRKAYLELQLRYKSAVEKSQYLETVNREAALKLEKLNTVPVEHEAEIKQLTENIRELEQLLRQDYRRKQAALQEVTSQKKTEIAEKTQILNEYKVSLSALKEEQEQLKSKIVESPEEGKNFNEMMKETIKKLKRSQQEVTEKYEGYRDLVEVLPSCQVELQLYQKKMEIQGENVERLATVSSEARNLEDQLESAQVELKKAKEDETSRKRAVTAKHEKLATAEIQLKKIREVIEQYKCTTLEQYNKVQEKRGAVCDKVMAIRKEVKQQKSKMEQLQDDYEKQAAKAKEIQLILKTVLDKYHESLLKAVKTSAASRAEKLDEIRRGLLSIQSSGSIS
ncbi:kinetochore protein Nuf2 [Catharus ustulatus]|uniref:NUF2 component of NDC80 kinetochore complex n=2 Tax=Catharus TaxID=9184 RepID=A0A8C3XYF6_CATUS|nr:kinetochore protein Nuf2 [Catharus ustulatus]